MGGDFTRSSFARSVFSLTLGFAGFAEAQLMPETSGLQNLAVRNQNQVQVTQTPFGFDVSEYVLENGLHVVLAPQKKLKSGTLTIQSWFRVGSIHEKMDPKLNKTGFAHFFEHMMFRGTAKHPDGFFDEFITTVGGRNLNASTSFDRTNYYATFPNKDPKIIEKVLQVELDRFTNLKVTQDLLDTERTNVISELVKGLERPGTQSLEKILKVVADGSPYAFSVIGTQAEIESVTVAECEYFLKTYYVPSNLSIVITGDFDEESALKQIKATMGSWKAPAAPQWNIPKPRLLSQKTELVLEHVNAQPDFIQFAFQSPPGAQSRVGTAIEIAIEYMSSGVNSPLYQKLVDTGLALAVGGGGNQFIGLGISMIQVTKAPGAEDAKVIQAVEETLKEFVTGTLDASRLAGIRAQSKAGIAQKFELPEDIGNTLGSSIVSRGSTIKDLQTYYELFALKESEIQAQAKTYLNPDRMLIVKVRQPSSQPNVQPKPEVKP